MKTKLIALTTLLASPTFAFAQSQPSGTTNFSSLQSALVAIGNLIETAIPILIAVAVLVFVYGVVKFIVNAGKEDARKEGARVMIGGIIGLFVILSVFALVEILQDTFGVDGENTIETNDIPTIPGL